MWIWNQNHYTKWNVSLSGGKVRVGRRNTQEFLVTWRGYPLDEAQWIPEANFYISSTTSDNS